MTAPHFVDTNLLVYCRDDTEPAKRDRALQIMRLLWETRRGRLSHQVLAEFYNTVTRKLSPGLPREEAAADVRSLLAWNPLPPGAAVLEKAWQIEERLRLSWWDSLVAASALILGCATLLSEDLQDGLRIEGLRVVNPFSPEFDLALLG